MARVVVGAYVVRFPMGGYLALVAPWLEGFRRLGHDVHLVEKAGWRNACYDARTRTMGDDPSYGVQVLRRFLGPFGLAERWAFVDADGRYHGAGEAEVGGWFRAADLFVDLGTHGTWTEEAAGCTSVLVDGEPGYRQIAWQLALERGEAIPHYDHHYTVGANVGTPRAAAPTADRSWRHVPYPVLLDLFPVRPAPRDAPFTTVMSWTVHDELEWEGRRYGQKDVEFARFEHLPQLTEQPLEVAVAGKAPRLRLREAGWSVRDGHEVTMSFEGYRAYIAASSGEFSVAKNVFVATRSGWFGDRSAAYLASGRPVVLVDTGFGDFLPTGEGLFAVRDADEAAEAIAEVRTDWARHSRAARAVAAEHLEAEAVLRRFLGEVGVE